MKGGEPALHDIGGGFQRLVSALNAVAEVIVEPFVVMTLRRERHAFFDRAEEGRLASEEIDKSHFALDPRASFGKVEPHCHSAGRLKRAERSARVERDRLWAQFPRQHNAEILRVAPSVRGERQARAERSVARL